MDDIDTYRELLKGIDPREGQEPIYSLAQIREIDRKAKEQEKLDKMLALSLLDLPPPTKATLAGMILEGSAPLFVTTTILVFTPDPIVSSAPSTTVAVVGLEPSPLEAKFFTVRTAPIAHLGDHRLELFGKQVWPWELRPEEATRAWTITLRRKGDEDEQIRFVAFRRRLYYGDTPYYIELRWEPGQSDAEEHIRLGGLEHLKRARDLPKNPREAIFKLQRTPKTWGGGRREGDGATWPGGLDHFLDDLWKTLEKRQESTGKKWGHDPTLRAFRLDMGNFSESRTMRTWLAKAKLRPQDIKSGKVTRESYRQFVAERGP